MNNIVVLSDLVSLALYLLSIGLTVLLSKLDLNHFNLVVYNENSNTLTIKRMIIVTLPLSFLAAFRYKVGSDYLNYYMTFFREIDKNSLELVYRYFLNGFKTELGMPGIMVARDIGRIFNSVHVYFGIMQTMILLPILMYLSKNSEGINISFALFIFIMENLASGFNVIKQTIACSILMLALSYLYDRKLLKYLVSLLVAMLFHFTSIIMLPIYYLWNKRNDISIVKKVIAFSGSILAVIVLMYFGNFFGDRWEAYTITGGSRNISFFISLFWLTIFFIYKKKLISLSPKNGLLMILYLIGTVLSVVGFWQVYTKRLSSFFLYPSFILISQIPNVVAEKNKRLVRIVIGFYEIFVFILTTMIMGQGSIFPYQVLVN